MEFMEKMTIATAILVLIFGVVARIIHFPDCLEVEIAARLFMTGITVALGGGLIYEIMEDVKEKNKDEGD